jgi:hypothetical protein
MGFEIDYWYKPALVGFSLPSNFWKTVGRRGTNAEAMERKLMISSSDSIQEINVTTGAGIEQLEIKTANNASVLCGQSSPTGTKETVNGYLIGLDSHFRNTLVGLDIKTVDKAFGDMVNTDTNRITP